MEKFGCRVALRFRKNFSSAAFSGRDRVASHPARIEKALNAVPNRSPYFGTDPRSAPGLCPSGRGHGPASVAALDAPGERLGAGSLRRLMRSNPLKITVAGNQFQLDNEDAHRILSGGWSCASPFHFRIYPTPRKYAHVRCRPRCSDLS